MFLKRSQKIPPKYLVKAFENFRKQELEEFRYYLKHPWRVMWINFIAGTGRGLGLLLGVAIIITVFGFVIKEWLSSIPVVGEFFLAIDQWIENTVRNPLR